MCLEVLYNNSQGYSDVTANSSLFSSPVQFNMFIFRSVNWACGMVQKINPVVLVKELANSIELTPLTSWWADTCQGAMIGQVWKACPYCLGQRTLKGISPILHASKTSICGGRTIWWKRRILWWDVEFSRRGRI